MGRSDGANAAPTLIGTAKPSVIAPPITTISQGPSLARSNATANIAPATANTNATASMDTFDHAANVGARARQGVTDRGVTGEGDPGRPQHRFSNAVHRDQLDGSPGNGAKDSILDEPQ